MEWQLSLSSDTDQYPPDVTPQVASVPSLLLFTSSKRAQRLWGETALLQISFLQGRVSAITSVVPCNLLGLAFPHVSFPMAAELLQGGAKAGPAFQTVEAKRG